jgi:hypothetical protein
MSDTIGHIFVMCLTGKEIPSGFLLFAEQVVEGSDHYWFEESEVDFLREVLNNV